MRRKIRLSRPMRRLVLGLITAFLAASGWMARDMTGGLVVDGDTLRFGGEKVRIWGIDAPEMKQTCTRHGMSYYCGQEAKEAMARIVTDAMLSCTPVGKDKYNRTVARCNADGQDVASIMVSQGWALDDTRYSKAAYGMAQIQAQVGKKGIWAGSFDQDWLNRTNATR